MSVQTNAKCFLSELRRREKKNGEVYYAFNAYIDQGEFKFLIGGFRVSKGKILPPFKFNPGTKKVFNTLYVSEAVARVMYDALSTVVEGLDSFEDATRTLLVTKARYDTFLDIKSDEKINVGKKAAQGD